MGLTQILKWFLLNAIIFVPLVYFFPSNKNQPKFHSSIFTDCIYFFCGPLIYGHVFRFAAVIVGSIGVVQAIHLHSKLAQLPLLLQVLLVLLATDFLQYWIHRAFHSAPLWKFHAIHHSATHVDWLTSARFHPVNFVLYSTAVNVFITSLGFSYQTFLILLPFNALYSSLVHANLNWSYGPFKYVLASPIFHRWHHTHPNEGGNKNFAPNFPIFDLLFGTFYMPKNRKPENFGAPYDSVGENILKQLSYPFKRKM